MIEGFLPSFGVRVTFGYTGCAAEEFHLTI